MKYWLHRISHVAELSHPLLDKGYITIGFSDLASDETIDKVLANDKSWFDKQVKKTWNSLLRSRHSLWRFLKEFQKGDLVIVPIDGAFHVCEILDDRPVIIGETHDQDLKTWTKKVVKTDGRLFLAENGKPYDLGFARKIKIHHKAISREKFADAKLTARMKMRQTNGSLMNIKASVEKSIENSENKKPVHLHPVILEKTAPIVLNSIIEELNPVKFEKLILSYLNSSGANEVYRPAKNERGKEGDADMIAVFHNLKLIIYVQAKFHKGGADEWGTNQILQYKTNKDSIDDGFNKIAWVITSAHSFNKTAQNIAMENQIQLINGIQFSEMLLDVGMGLLKTNPKF